MPIIAQAAKKLRHDKTRSIETAKARRDVREAVKTTRATPNAKNLSAVFKILDKAAKRNIIHANKAARLKSRLAKLLKK